MSKISSRFAFNALIILYKTLISSHSLLGHRSYLIHPEKHLYQLVL